jgi:predicted ribosomally synthesized peptide with nif11-like leader
MKTLEEFIQRLQDDPVFERQACAFDNGDELMAFVQSEGYDFTLEQLMREFNHGTTSPTEGGGKASTPAEVSASTGARLHGSDFPGRSEAFPNCEQSGSFLKNGSGDVTPVPTEERLPHPKKEVPPQDPAEESPGGLFRGGGGRHRGFSSRRLKSISMEEP